MSKIKNQSKSAKQDSITKSTEEDHQMHISIRERKKLIKTELEVCVTYNDEKICDKQIDYTSSLLLDTAIIVGLLICLYGVYLSQG